MGKGEPPATGGSDGTGAHACPGWHGGTGGGGWLAKTTTPTTTAMRTKTPTKMATIAPELVRDGAGDGAHVGRP